VTIHATGEAFAALLGVAADLRDVFIVSQAQVTDAPAPAEAIRGEVESVAVVIAKALGEKCARCWIYDENLGTDPEHPTACPRCTQVLKEYHA
jgi:isoleucyl-tRNA synthetase